MVFIHLKSSQNRRRERDLNSRATRTRDFQSRAIPGYAISARNPATPIPCLTLSLEFDEREGERTHM